MCVHWYWTDVNWYTFNFSFLAKTVNLSLLLEEDTRYQQEVFTTKRYIQVLDDHVRSVTLWYTVIIFQIKALLSPPHIIVLHNKIIQLHNMYLIVVLVLHYCIAVENVVFCKMSTLQSILYKHLLGSHLVKSCLRRSTMFSPHLVCIGALKKLSNSPSFIYEAAAMAGACDEQSEREDSLLPMDGVGYL